MLWIITFYNGSYQQKDKISPSYINLKNPKYIEIDNLYYSSLIIVNYEREQKDILLKSILESNYNIIISLFYEKLDNYKMIKDLTYHIGNVGVDLKTIDKNRQDMDLAAFSYDDARYIRREIQVNNEDIYYFYCYLTAFEENEQKLEYLLNQIEGMCQSRGMQTRRAIFRQEQSFLATSPIMQNPLELKKIGKRNILTSSLISTYPFISSTVFDEKGIFIGTNIYNNSLIFLDRYDKTKYKNANICIFGTSGAGKSFFTKLMILRSKLYGITQYIIDPEREYIGVCQYLEGALIKLGPKSQTFINIFDIRKESIENNESGYLATKIGKLIGFFHLIFGQLNEEEKALIEEKLINLYNEKGITFEDKSLWKENKNKIKEFRKAKDMPLLEDFYSLLGKDNRTKNFQIKLIPFVKGSLKFFNHFTNIELNKKIIVADIYDLGEENIQYGMYLFTELFWDKIKINRKEKKAIYFDEVWRLIGITSNKETAGFVYKIFKTIRKYGGSAVAITQDISDLFSLENGNYGRSIINNSEIKTFFALEEDNIQILEKYTKLSEKEKIEIKTIKTGECLMFLGNNHILANINHSSLEKRILEGTKNE